MFTVKSCWKSNRFFFLFFFFFLFLSRYVLFIILSVLHQISIKRQLFLVKTFWRRKKKRSIKDLTQLDYNTKLMTVNFSIFKIPSKVKFTLNVTLCLFNFSLKSIKLQSKEKFREKRHTWESKWSLIKSLNYCCSLFILLFVDFIVTCGREKCIHTHRRKHRETQKRERRRRKKIQIFGELDGCLTILFVNFYYFFFFLMRDHLLFCDAAVQIEKKKNLTTQKKWKMCIQ